MKKVSEMPWDDPDFVEAMRVAFRAGYSAGEHAGYNYYESHHNKTGDSFEYFMIESKAGFQD